MTAIVAVALFALAIGCAGFGAFAIKTPLVSAGASAGNGASGERKGTGPGSA